MNHTGMNPLIRGLALRVMTSIRVADIIQIQLLAVRKCATDSSPYVRKCAANAVPKIFSMVSAYGGETIKRVKLLLAMLSKGFDLPESFPEKVVYSNLVHCADCNGTYREAALLSVRSLTDEAHNHDILINCKVSEPSFYCFLVIARSIA